MSVHSILAWGSLTSALVVSGCLFDLRAPKELVTAAGTGALKLSAQEGVVAEVYLNGQLVNRSLPVALTDIPEGEVELAIVADGYQILRDTLEVKTGQTLDQKLTLERSQPFVNLKLNPQGGLGAQGVKAYVHGLETDLESKWPQGETPIRLQKGTAIWDTVVNLTAETSLQPLLENRQWVLLEHFSNVACLPCPSVDRAVEAFLKETDKRVVHMSVHTNFPSTNDPFFKPYAESILERIGPNYYAIPSAPRVLMNGTLTGTRQDSVKIPQYLRDSVPGALALTPSWHLEIMNFAQSNAQVQFKIKAQNVANSSAANVRVRAAWVEKELHMDEAPGVNGLKHFEHLFRGMVLAEDLSSSAQEWQVQAVNPLGNRPAQLVIWLENPTERKILQTLRFDLPTPWRLAE